MVVHRSEATAARETETVVEDEEDGPVVVAEVEPARPIKSIEKNEIRYPCDKSSEWMCDDTFGQIRQAWYWRIVAAYQEKGGTFWDSRVSLWLYFLKTCVLFKDCSPINPDIQLRLLRGARIS